MKNLKIILLLELIFLSLENKYSKKKRKLEESYIIYESIDEIYDSINEENPEGFQSEIEIFDGNSTYFNSSDTSEVEEISTSVVDNSNIIHKDSSTIENTSTNTEISDEINSSNIPNYTEISDEINSSNIPNHTEILDEINSSNIPNHTEISNEVNSSNIPNHTEISNEVNSSIIENNTIIDKIPINNPIYSSKLILLGFGHYFRPIIQPQNIFFIVYFFRILGNNPSRYLRIPINIVYSTRLRFLEENNANCTRITNDNNVNIQYNCSVPVDPNKSISSLNIIGNDLSFGNGENISYIFSSIANQTKGNLLSQTGNDLDKGIIVIKDTILEKDNEKFLLIGNSSEKFSGSKIILSLDNNGNIIYIDCYSKNLLGNIYEFECIPNESINNHLNGVSGKTEFGKNLVINFQDGKDDLVDIRVNNSTNNDNNYNYETIKKVSSSSGLSAGAIAGIVIGGAVLLIAIITLIGCCCRKGEVKPPFEESSIQKPFPKDTTNESI